MITRKGLVLCVVVLLAALAPCFAQADLELDAEAPVAVRKERPFLFTFRVTNIGDDSALGVVIGCSLSGADILDVGVDPDPNLLSSDLHSIEAMFDDLAAGAEVEITVAAKVPFDTVLGAAITGTASSANTAPEEGVIYVGLYDFGEPEQLDLGVGPDMALDAAGNVHISYSSLTDPEDVGDPEDPGYVPPLPDVLRYVTNAGGDWQVYDLYFQEGGGIGRSAITVDQDNNVHIMYTVGNPEGTSCRLDYVFRPWDPIAAQWREWSDSETVVQSAGDLTDPEASWINFPYPDLSLAADPDGKLHCSYVNKYRLEDSWTYYGPIVYITGEAGNWTKTQSDKEFYNIASLALDPDGSPYIAAMSFVGDAIALYSATDIDGASTSVLLWENAPGTPISVYLAVDEANVKHVAYVTVNDGQPGDDLIYSLYYKNNQAGWNIAVPGDLRDWVTCPDPGGGEIPIGLSPTDLAAGSGTASILYYFVDEHDPDEQNHIDEIRLSSYRQGSWERFLVANLFELEGGSFAAAVDPEGSIQHVAYTGGYAEREEFGLYYANDASTDSDGLTGPEEWGPEGNAPDYDGNNDGTADRLQDNVASFHAARGDYYVTLSAPEDVVLTDVQALENPDPSAQYPDGLGEEDFPAGFFGFTAYLPDGWDSTIVTLHLHESTAGLDSYWKYGGEPEPENSDPHWYEFDYDGATGAQILNDRVDLYLIDGERGDNDLRMNSFIVEPGGPVLAVVVNEPPTADAGPDQFANEGLEITLDGSGSYDPEGELLSYSWSQSAGPTVALRGADTERPGFTAPEVDADTELRFQLVVNDGELGSAADEVVITVLNLINQPPVADAGADQIVDEGSAVTLDGSGSRDPEGQPLSYRWSQTGEPKVDLSDTGAESPSFTAPEVDADTELRFQLVVNDGVQDSVADEIVVTVVNTLVVPVANAGGPYSGEAGVPVSFDASSSYDPDGAVVSYEWDWNADGEYDDATDQPSIEHTWSEAHNGVVVLRVTDDDGLTATDEAEVSIAAENQPPVADAGADQIVDEGSAVTLDGSGSRDPEGQPLSYRWSQTGEPKVDLSDTGAESPSFTAPEVDADTELRFQLVVNDGVQDSTAAVVVVTVRNLSGAPELTGSWVRLRYFAAWRWNFVLGMIRVRNSGEEYAGRFDVEFYLSNDGTALGQKIDKVSIRSGIQPGKSRPVPFFYGTNDLLKGKYIVAVIDAGQVIPESNEENNILTKVIK